MYAANNVHGKFSLLRKISKIYIRLFMYTMYTNFLLSVVLNMYFSISTRSGKYPFWEKETSEYELITYELKLLTMLIRTFIHLDCLILLLLHTVVKKPQK